MLLDGLHIPLTTPFYPDGRLYLRKLEHNVDRYSRTPATGLSILSPTGEPSLLSDDETREVLRTAIEASAPEKVLLAGISRDSVRTTLDLAGFAAALNFDAVTLHLPRGLHLETKAALTYLRAIGDRSPLPILLHDLDASLPLDLVAELSANPAFLGLIEHGDSRLRLRRLREATAAGATREVVVTPVFAAVTRRMAAPAQPSSQTGGNYIAADSLSGSATALATAPPVPGIRTRTKKIGFQLLTGQTSALLDALEAGASGAVLPLAACAPQAVYEVLAAWKDGDPKLAAEKQSRLDDAAARIEEMLGVAGIKTGCDLNGYFGGNSRLPLLPLTREDRDRVEALLSPMRN